ncbi:MAG: hypothetical protein ACOYNM_15020, partial [Gemmataceae bacterium]
AKGPFPGGKRVGSWGKKKSKRKRKKVGVRGRGRGLGEKKAKTKGGGNQTANFPKPSIILILADDVGGILIMPHSLCFID